MVDALPSRAEEGRRQAALSYDQALAAVVVDFPMGQPTPGYAGVPSCESEREASG